MITAYISCDYLIYENISNEQLSEYMKSVKIEFNKYDDLLKADFPVLPSPGHEIAIDAFMSTELYSEEFIEQCSKHFFKVSNILWINAEGEAVPVIICKKVDAEDIE